MTAAARRCLAAAAACAAARTALVPLLVAFMDSRLKFFASFGL